MSENSFGPLIHILLGLLLIFPVLLSFTDSFLRLIYLLVGKKKQFLPHTHSHFSFGKVLFLIFASNEEHVISQTLDVLFRSIDSNPNCSVGVVCDHCTDDTEKIVSAYDVLLFSRSDGPQGKGAAISWLVNHHATVIQQVDIVVVLDADSLVEKNFCMNIQQPFLHGAEVVQAFIQPIYVTSAPATMLASYSELLSEHMDDAARVSLGWAVPLRGTGMAFRSDSFLKHCSHLITYVEDIELSILFGAEKIPVVFEDSAIIFDPKSDELMGLARQRGRWLQGQRQVLGLMWSRIIALSGMGLQGISILQAVLFKPKTFVFGMKALIWGLTFWMGSSGWLTAINMGMLACIVVDVSYILAGITFWNGNNRRLEVVKSVFVFVWLWIISLGISIFSKTPWLSARFHQKPLGRILQVSEENRVDYE